jgi:outer membrane protein assembly factor BamB
MQAYRDAPAPLPLVTSIAGVVLALDPETGARIWSTKLESRIARVLVAGRLVFVATRSESLRDASEIVLLDLETGAQRSALEVTSTMNAAIARGDRVYFAGPLGCVALAIDGRMLWQARADVTRRGTFIELRDLVGYDATGHEMWRIAGVSYGLDVFLALGDIIAQPDFDGGG